MVEVQRWRCGSEHARNRTTRRRRTFRAGVPVRRQVRAVQQRVATEGFRLAADAIGPAATGPRGFARWDAVRRVRADASWPLRSDVSCRPVPCGRSRPDRSRDAASRSSTAGLGISLSAKPGEDVTGAVVAGWALSHGFASLWMTGNLQDRTGADPVQFAINPARGIVRLGELAQRQIDSA